jgi:hypothetical protein
VIFLDDDLPCCEYMGFLVDYGLMEKLMGDIIIGCYEIDLLILVRKDL